MKKTEKIKRIYFRNKKIPIYNFDIDLEIVVSNDRYKLDEYMTNTYAKNDFLLEFYTAGSAVSYEFGNVIVVFDTEYISINSIIHESVHAADKVFLVLSEKVKGSHCFVYLVEWIANQIIKFFQKENFLNITYSKKYEG